MSCWLAVGQTVDQSAETLSVSKKYVKFTYVGDTEKITVTSSTEWTCAAQTSDWCTVKRNGNVITIKTLANFGSSSRSIAISIKTNNGARQVLVSVVQDGCPETTLQVSPDSLSVPAKGGSRVCYVTTDAARYSVSLPQWCHLDKQSKESFTLNYDANNSSVPRTGLITVAADDKVEKIAITQSKGATVTVAPERTTGVTSGTVAPESDRSSDRRITINTGDTADDDRSDGNDRSGDRDYSRNVKHSGSSDKSGRTRNPFIRLGLDLGCEGIDVNGGSDNSLDNLIYGVGVKARIGRCDNMFNVTGGIRYNYDVSWNEYSGLYAPVMLNLNLIRSENFALYGGVGVDFCLWNKEQNAGFLQCGIMSQKFDLHVNYKDKLDWLGVGLTYYF